MHTYAYFWIVRREYSFVFLQQQYFASKWGGKKEFSTINRSRERSFVIVATSRFFRVTRKKLYLLEIYELSRINRNFNPQ